MTRDGVASVALVVHVESQGWCICFVIRGQREANAIGRHGAPARRVIEDEQREWSALRAQLGGRGQCHQGSDGDAFHMR